MGLARWPRRRAIAFTDNGASDAINALDTPVASPQRRPHRPARAANRRLHAGLHLEILVSPHRSAAMLRKHMLQPGFNLGPFTCDDLIIGRVPRRSIAADHVDPAHTLQS